MTMRRQNQEMFCSQICAANLDSVSKALSEANRQNALLRSVLRVIAEMPQESAGNAPVIARDILARL